MVPCLSQLTTLPQSFDADIHTAAQVGWPALEVWLTKLEQHLEKHTIAETQQLVHDSGVRLVAAAGQGGLFVEETLARRSHWEHFRRRLELCQALSIPVLVVALDLPASWSRQASAELIAQLQRAADWAQAFGVRLAIEFQANAPFCNCLDTAVTLIHSCRHPALQVCLDLFHFYKGPSKTEDLHRLHLEHLGHVQVCDVAGLPREVWTDADRIFPGEGDLPLPELLAPLIRLGYTGPISLEVPNPQLWQAGATQVMHLAWTAWQNCWNNLRTRSTDSTPQYPARATSQGTT